MFSSHPWELTLSRITCNARIAAGMCVSFLARRAKRKVDAAKSAVEDESANESGSSM